MRTLIYQWLSNDAGFTDIVEGGLYSDRSLEVVPSVKPFCVLMYEGPNPGMSRVRQMTLRAWVHDEPGDYLRIEEALKYLRDLLPTGLPRRQGDIWLMEAQWLGDSADLYDETRRTNVKNAVFLLTGSGL